MAQTHHKARIAIKADVVDPHARFLMSVIVIRPMLNGHLTLHDCETLALCDADNLIYKLDSGYAPQEEVPLGAPENTVAPVVTGSGSYDEELTCDPGEWTNDPDEIGYQWKKGSGTGTPIIGETEPVYTPPKSERGNTVFCSVTASNALGWGAADSNRITIGNIVQTQGADMIVEPVPPDPSAGRLNTTGTVVDLNIPLDYGLTCSGLGANGEFLVVYTHSA